MANLSQIGIDQNKVIKEVLEFLSKTINLKYKITDYPDEVERNLSACDALATMGRTKLAIEHTSIDSFLQQRKNISYIIKALGPLVEELKNKLPLPGQYKLGVHANVIPSGKGIKWDDIRRQIYNWCLNVAARLEMGSSRTAPKHFIRAKPEGIPFEVSLYRWPGHDGRFSIINFIPEDLEDQRKKVIYESITSRGTKVASYKNSDFRTILVLESNDIQLGNASDIGRAFASIIKEFKSMTMPHEVYLVQTEMQPYYIDCLKFGERLFPEVCISREPYI